MSSSVPMEVAGVIQSASIRKAPSAQHDINPSTAASKREPVTLEKYDDLGEDDDDTRYGVIKNRPRPPHAYPLPDLRFEQSYLKSIEKADTWDKVIWVTVRDQIMMPFIQGLIYNIGLCGWQSWNKSAKMSGGSLGARVRRWLYGANRPVPRQKLR